MKRTMLYALAAMLLLAATPVQADPTEPDTEPRDDRPEKPGDDYAWWDAQGQWCKIAHVYGPYIQPTIDPLLGIASLDPEDCYLVVVEYLWNKIFFFVETGDE